jgi:hypothetical protein
MENFKRAGILKQYDLTDTTFVKKGMWPDRYYNELNGLALASASGISTPTVVSSRLDETGGTIVYERLDFPRLDEVLWERRTPEVFTSVGHVLAEINAIPSDKEVSMHLPRRRFKDLENDVLSRGVMPDLIVALCASLFDHACKKVACDRSGLVHGDFVLQNIFHDNPLIVFDWEHSGFSSSAYEVGGLLSFMLLLALDGGWNLREYCLAIEHVFDGYGQRASLDRRDPYVHTFRFLGHRQVPQYYLFVLEYLAVIQKNGDVKDILAGKASTREASAALSAVGIHMDQTWLEKIILALRSHEYQISHSLWDWYRKEGMV